MHQEQWQTQTKTPPRPETIQPLYTQDGTFFGAFIDGAWWWPEDLELLQPDLCPQTHHNTEAAHWKTRR